MSGVAEGIRVGVVHGPGGKIKPVWFDLNNRQYKIRQITNSWKERCGQTSLIYFHVTDGGALYELSYNLSDSCWCLEQIEAL